MADQGIVVAEHVYRGGTIVAPAGSVITPEAAYVLGVGEDGKVDWSLSTDDLLRRAQESADPVDTAPSVPSVDATDQIGDATAEQVIAYLEANPSEVESVAAAESQRDRPRKTVMDAVDRLRSDG